MLKSTVLLVMLLLISSPLFAAVCFQESTNVSTACGGLATGVYSSESSTGGSPPYFMAVNMNYTKPVASFESLWQIKYYQGSTNTNYTTNYSIPAICWNAYSDKLRLRVAGGVGDTKWHAQCYNSSDWQDIVTWYSIGGAGSTSGDVANVYDGDYTTGVSYDYGTPQWNAVNYDTFGGALFEEAMYWNTTNTFVSSCQNIASTGTYTMNASITGASASPCFNISSSNVVLDCNNYNLNGNGGNYGQGIALANIENISIKNCNITNFWYNLNTSNITHFNLTNITSSALVWGYISGTDVIIDSFSTLYEATNVNIVNSTIRNSSLISAIFNYLGVSHDVSIINSSGYFDIRGSNFTLQNITTLGNGINLDSTTENIFLSNIIAVGNKVELAGNNISIINSEFTSIWLGLEGSSIIANNITMNNSYVYIDSADAITMTNSIVSSNSAYTGAFEIYNSQNVSISNNVIEGNTSKCFYVGTYSSGNFSNASIFNNTMTNCSYGLFVDATAAVYDVALYNNNITATTWVDSSIVALNSISLNNSLQGNIYYFINGTPAWEVYLWEDTDSDGWADQGTDYPASSATINEILGHVVDYKPFTNITGVATSPITITITSAPAVIVTSRDTTIGYTIIGTTLTNCFVELYDNNLGSQITNTTVACVNGSHSETVPADHVYTYTVGGYSGATYGFDTAAFSVNPATSGGTSSGSGGGSSGSGEILPTTTPSTTSNDTLVITTKEEFVKGIENYLTGTFPQAALLFKTLADVTIWSLNFLENPLFGMPLWFIILIIAIVVVGINILQKTISAFTTISFLLIIVLLVLYVVYK